MRSSFRYEGMINASNPRPACVVGLGGGGKYLWVVDELLKATNFNICHSERSEESQQICHPEFISGSDRLGVGHTIFKMLKRVQHDSFVSGGVA